MDDTAIGHQEEKIKESPGGGEIKRKGHVC